MIILEVYYIALQILLCDLHNGNLKARENSRHSKLFPSFKLKAAN